jgi:ATP-dependent RNA helicase RhlE
LLAHIIQEHNWSQVLVFTRTKFGANNVAEFLTKNGIQAMALHGNKSQAARTQALSGFKSGDIRALVATDIAARGIDIDDLPHVVNYEIPNVCEDYVHRIGRTGRAGADGTAVNLVCLDEEGFMQAIERYTKQNIPVQIVEGFMPEPGEKAEPIAMGRQTVWGGAGKPPSRDVMMAAGKAARTEMLTRVRESKGAQGDRGGNAGSGRGGNNGGGGQRSTAPRSHAPNSDFQPPRSAQRPAQGRGGNGGGYGGGNANGGGGFGGGHGGNAPARAPQGQPDPMRTSVDMMAERGARRGGGGFGGGNRSGGSYAGAGGGRSGGGGTGGFGGGGNGSRGPGGSRGSFNR